MSTPRLARANRSRFFIGLGILILTVGFVAIFHSSQQQLDDLRQMELRCEQQQEALSQQIQSKISVSHNQMPIYPEYIFALSSIRKIYQIRAARTSAQFQENEGHDRAGVEYEIRRLATELQTAEKPE